MRECEVCNRVRDLKHFDKKRKVCYSCRYSKYDKGKSLLLEQKEYHKQYYKDTVLTRKYKAYCHSDRVRDKSSPSVARYKAIDLMRMACVYCTEFPSNGLDRVDSSLNHTEENVVPCCEKCNNILGDLPPSAKNILANGLKEINKKELLKDWIIPTKRRKK